MSREAAKVVLDVVLKHAAEQDATLVDIERLCSQDEFAQYKKMIGKSMGAMLIDVINPIVAKYPDLKPPQLV
jgi:hypothetical protein